MVMRRKCSECRAKVQAVCRHVFGKAWAAKSGNGAGCNHPMDAVAEQWYSAGWMPSPEITAALTLPLTDLPTMPKRPVRPQRPMQQADLTLKPTRAKHERETYYHEGY